MLATTIIVVVMVSATVASLRIHPEGSLDVFFCARGVHIFKNIEPPQNYKRLKGDMTQVPY